MIDFERLFLKSWHPYVWILCSGVCLYSNTLFFSEFTNQDDYTLIVENFQFNSNIANIGRAFQEDVFHLHQGGVFYRPLLTLSFMVDAHIGGTSLFVYRTSNILFHIIAASLLFSTLQKIGSPKASALFLSLLFCFHPGLTQAIAWIPGRNDSLLAVFILSAFLAQCSFHTSHHLRWFVLHMVFFAAALFTKESAIVFVPLAFAFLAWTAEKKHRALELALFASGWIIIILNWYVLRRAADIVQISDYSHAFKIIFDHLWVVFSHLTMFMWPTDPFVISIAKDFSIIKSVLALLSVLLLIALAVKRRWELLVFGALWFVMFLLPTFYQAPSEIVRLKFYEHRVYVPFIGLIFMFSAISFEGRGSITVDRRFKRIGGATLLGALVLLSIRHSFTFEDAMTFSEQTVVTSPHNGDFLNDIRRMYLPPPLDSVTKNESRSSMIEYDELDQARTSLELRIKNNPNEIESRHSLAIVDYGLGRLKSSEREFKEIISRNPENTYAHYNLGNLYYKGFLKQRAEGEWLQSITLDPTFPLAHHNLAYLYYEWQKYVLALSHCRLAQNYGAVIPPEFVRELQSHTR